MKSSQACQETNRCHCPRLRNCKERPHARVAGSLLMHRLRVVRSSKCYGQPTRAMVTHRPLLQVLPAAHSCSCKHYGQRSLLPWPLQLLGGSHSTAPAPGMLTETQCPARLHAPPRSSHTAFACKQTSLPSARQPAPYWHTGGALQDT